MEALVDLWAAPDDLAPWPVIPSATSSVWSTPSDLSVSGQSSQFTPVYEWASTSWNVWSGVAEQAAVSALTAVGSVLEAALQALEKFIVAAIQKLLSVVIAPLVLGLKTSVQELQGAIDAWTQNLDADYAANSVSTPSPAGEEILALALTLGTVVAVLLQIAVGVSVTLSLGAGLLLGILVTVVINAVSQVGASASNLGSGSLSTIEGLITGSASTGYRAVVSLVEEAFNLTQSPLKSTDIQPFGDPSSSSKDPDLFGIFAALAAEGGAVDALITLGFSSRLSGDAYPVAETGMYLALSGMMLAILEAVASLFVPSTCNSSDVLAYDSLLTMDVAGMTFSAFGEGFAIYGFETTDPPVDEASLVAGIAGAAAFILGAGSAAALHSECATA